MREKMVLLSEKETYEAIKQGTKEAVLVLLGNDFNGGEIIKERLAKELYNAIQRSIWDLMMISPDSLTIEFYKAVEEGTRKSVKDAIEAREYLKRIDEATKVMEEEVKKHPKSKVLKEWAEKFEKLGIKGFKNKT